MPLHDTSWIRGKAAWVMGAGLLLVFVACATAPAPQAASSLTDLNVESAADGTTVTLFGTGDSVARAYQEDGRLVVDLDGVAPGEAAPTTVVFDGTVDKVQLAAHGEGTRVEIALGTDVAHELVPGTDSVTIHVVPTLGDGLASASDDGFLSSEAPVAKPATRLSTIVARDEEGGVLVELGADGSIEGMSHFAMENPTRLVVDLPGLSSDAAPRTSVETSLVSRIRVGQHEDKVRVVLDAAEGVEDFGQTELQTTATGLALALGGAPLPALAPVPVPVAAATPDEAEVSLVAASEEAPTAWAAAEVPVEETAEVEDPWAATETRSVVGDEGKEATLADEMAQETQEAIEIADDEPEVTPAWESSEPATRTVFGVQLDTTESRDRVVIVGDGPMTVSTFEPDAETLMVQITGAKIDPDATSRVVATKPGAVSMVSAFEQPEADVPTVRVVIQKASGLSPKLWKRGPMVLLDFPQGEGVARAVPAMTEPPATTWTAAGAAAMPAAIAGGGSIDVLAEGGLVDGKLYTGRRISLDFKDVDIDDVLRLIAEVSDLNVIAGDEVQGAVTIRLVDVPWDQALDVILLTKGLGFVRVGNVLRIAPTDVLKTEEEARLQEKRAKEKLEDLVVKLQPVNYATVSEVAGMVKRLLTARGSVDVDARTNTLILKDIASVIQEATALVKAIDTQTPQVMIEAKIVEARLDFLRELGATWGVGSQDNVDAFDSNSGLRTSSSNPGALGGEDFILNTTAGNAANNFIVANPITQLATGSLNLGAFLLDERFDVDVQIQAAESHGEGKVISSPRIVTLDNRKASIQQGVSIPFQTFENGDAQLEFIDAVLKLDVTPHITADRSIIMVIEVKRNAPDDSVPTPTGSPAIAKNEARTETLVRDGQTLVIGGIYTVDNAELESRVPYLHKIPVLGAAFKNKSIRDSRQELLVFVTPRIVVNPELGS
jgi:type IV pilus assembly protein PilQ